MNYRSTDRTATIETLVKQFLSVALAQYDAIYVLDNEKYSRLYAQMQKIRDELSTRILLERPLRTYGSPACLLNARMRQV